MLQLFMKSNKNQQPVFLCSNCGETYPKWSGSCANCGEWNTLKEYKQNINIPKSQDRVNVSNIQIQNISTYQEEYTARIKSSINAWDNVLSGGMIQGQVILFSGDPGIGKSTLLLQIISQMKSKVLYFSGEETTQQIISRAKRIDSHDDAFLKTDFVNLNSLEELESLAITHNYEIVIVDSIQTISSQSTGGIPGSVSQIRECTLKMAQLAKQNNFIFIIVGQVTKEGDIAGPKLLEHLVDTVMYFEGDKNNDLRVLKLIKNRYGNTNEVAFFEMKQSGLKALDNPSNLIIDRSKELLEGSCYSLALEGNIPIILELQALCNRSVFNYPKFVSTGYPLNRLQMICAIISKRTKINLSDQDIYLNIIGGIKIDDPQIDLGVCMAIASSFFKKPVNKNYIFFGELGLTGEVRFNKSKEKRINFATTNKFETEHFSKLNKIESYFNLLK